MNGSHIKSDNHNVIKWELEPSLRPKTDAQAECTETCNQ